MVADARLDNGLRLRGAVFAARNGVVITDATRPNGPLMRISGAFERVTGYASEEVWRATPAGRRRRPIPYGPRMSGEANEDIARWTGLPRNRKKEGGPAVEDHPEHGRADTHGENGRLLGPGSAPTALGGRA